MNGLKFYSVLFWLVATSCSFNSTFFAVKKQNLDSRIVNLPYDEVYFESVDNKNIYSLLLKPEKESIGTIFFLQGSGDNISSWSNHTKHFVEEGYQVFMMEYRGFGSDSGKATHKNVLSDAERALINLTNKEGIIGNKIIIVGHSYGGQIAINLTAKYPDKVSMLLIEGTFTSFKDEVVYQVPFFMKPFLKVFTSSMYKSKDLIRKISGIPILIIHSKDDKTVPFRMGQELYSNANEPKYFWEIRGKHIQEINNYTQEYMSRIKMLTKYKKATIE